MEEKPRAITKMSPAARAAAEEYATLILLGKDPRAAEAEIRRKYPFPEGSDDWVVMTRAVFKPMAAVQAEKQPQASGCFIATAACGSPDVSDVVTLRRFRDDSLIRSRFGRGLVRVYERASPGIAAQIARRPALRQLVRILIVKPLGRLLSLRA